MEGGVLLEVDVREVGSIFGGEHICGLKWGTIST